MVERMAFTESPRWRLSFSEWASCSRARTSEQGVVLHIALRIARTMPYALDVTPAL